MRSDQRLFHNVENAFAGEERSFEAGKKSGAGTVSKVQIHIRPAFPVVTKAAHSICGRDDPTTSLLMTAKAPRQKVPG